MKAEITEILLESYRERQPDDRRRHARCECGCPLDWHVYRAGRCMVVGCKCEKAILSDRRRK